MKRYALVLACIALSACTTSRTITLADGTQGQKIACNGAVQTMNDCYAKAGEMCPRGFDVIGADGEAHPFAMSNGGFSANPYYASGGYTSTMGTVVTRSMIVRCH
jgi:hypothetical protein